MARQLIAPIEPSEWRLALYTKDEIGIGLPVLWFELQDTIGRAPILGFMNGSHFKTLFEAAATTGTPPEVGLYGARSDATLRPVNPDRLKLDVTVGAESVSLNFALNEFWQAFDEA